MHVAWLAGDTDHLPRVRPEADPVKEVSEDVKRPLQPLRLVRYDYAIVGIEICCQVPYRQDKYLPVILVWNHHRHPVADDGIHKHVEERGGKGLALGHAAVIFEWKYKVSAGPGDHGQLSPVCPIN